jgi:hypothetical protein
MKLKIVAIISTFLPVPMAPEKTFKSCILHVHPGDFFLKFSVLKISTTKAQLELFPESSEGGILGKSTNDKGGNCEVCFRKAFQNYDDEVNS